MLLDLSVACLQEKQQEKQNKSHTTTLQRATDLVSIFLQWSYFYDGTIELIRWTVPAGPQVEISGHEKVKKTTKRIYLLYVYDLLVHSSLKRLTRFNWRLLFQ